MALPARFDWQTRQRLQLCAKRLGTTVSGIIRFSVKQQLRAIESGVIHLARPSGAEGRNEMNLDITIKIRKGMAEVTRSEPERGKQKISDQVLVGISVPADLRQAIMDRVSINEEDLDFSKFVRRAIRREIQNSGFGEQGEQQRGRA